MKTIKSYYLEDITIEHKRNPRIFMKPTVEELDGLKIGEMVRLLFVFNFTAEDNCRAERMWVEISEINGDQFKGYLTNQPIYIKDLQLGEIVEFKRNNIATIIVKALFDEKKMAIITRRALQQRTINWILRDEPCNEQDSGWQLFYGDEDQDYVDNADNSVLISLDKVLDFEPRLEKVFASDHIAFEWDEEEIGFVEVDY